MISVLTSDSSHSMIVLPSNWISFDFTVEKNHLRIDSMSHLDMYFQLFWPMLTSLPLRFYIIFLHATYLFIKIKEFLVKMSSFRLFFTLPLRLEWNRMIYSFVLSYWLFCLITNPINHTGCRNRLYELETR